MSSQPSTVESIRDSASNALGAAANAVSTENSKPSEPETTKDLQGQVCEKGDYKDQLSRASQGPPQPKEATYVDKVLSYIPGVSSTPAASQDPAKTAPPNEGQPPHRPDHDTQLEEFIREQYRTDGNKPA